MSSERDSSSLRLLTVTCRFVQTDQWFTTHLDPTWRIKQVKHWLLTKCGAAPTDAEPPRYRPASPITFASTPPQPPGDGLLDEDALDDDDLWGGASGDSEDEDQVPLKTDPEQEHDRRRPDGPGVSRSPSPAPMPNPAVHPRQTPSPQPASTSRLPRQKKSSAPSPPPAEAYTLLTFSTLQLLEDDFTLSWYHLRPYELLELHPHTGVVALPRDLDRGRGWWAYVQPYLELRVRALRVVAKEEHGAEESAHVHVKREEKKNSAHRGWDRSEAKAREKEREREARHARDAERSFGEVSTGSGFSSFRSKGKTRERDHEDRSPRGGLKARDSGCGDSFRGTDSMRSVDREREREKEKARKPRARMEWKARSAIVWRGVLYIMRDRDDTSPHIHPLSTLTSLRDADYLLHRFPSVPRQKRTVCAQFRIAHPLTPYPAHAHHPSTASTSASSPGDSPHTTPTTRRTAPLGSPWSVVEKPANGEGGAVWGFYDSEYDHLHGHSSSDGSATAAGISETEWVVLEMEDDNSYTAFLRVLHRAQPTTPSSFIPASAVASRRAPSSSPEVNSRQPSSVSSPNTITPSLKSSSMNSSSPSLANTSPTLTSHAKGKGKARADEPVPAPDVQASPLSPKSPFRDRPTFATPFPEWRTAALQRAQRAGLGGISRALECAMFGPTFVSAAGSGNHSQEALSAKADEFGGGALALHRALQSSVASRARARALASLSQYGSANGSAEELDVSDDGSDEGDSEAEWEGWPRDLVRQARVQARRHRNGSSSADDGAGWDGHDEFGWGWSWEGAERMRAAEERQLLIERRAMEPSARIHLPAFAPGSAGHEARASTTSIITALANGPDGQKSSASASVSTSPPMSPLTYDFAFPREEPPPPRTKNEAMMARMTTTTSVVTVGPPPPASAKDVKGRKRSSTIGAAFLRGKSKTKDEVDTTKDKEIGAVGGKKLAKPKLSLNFGAPPPDAPVSSIVPSAVTANLPGPSLMGTSHVRHVRSSSSLYHTPQPHDRPEMPRNHVQSPLAGGDAAQQGSPIEQPNGGRTGRARMMSGLGLVRGVSVRAERIVKGLDSALEFVDGR